MSQLVTLSRQGNVGVIALNNPPVNALSHAARLGLVQALSEGLADAALGALVIWCEGRTFVAGADIREFGKPPLDPDLPEVVEFVASARKPVIAALHGTALGGGLELALACDFRVAATSTKMGFPEVTLGILPGAGGTQRLPRLIGARAALDMIVGGTPIAASKALTLGLVDELVEDELLAGAVAFAERVLSERRPLQKLGERRVSLAEPGLFDEYERKLAGPSRGFLAPFRCIEAIRAAVELDFDAGLAREGALFRELMASPQSKAQRHVFFAEREVARAPGLPDGTTPREVKKVAVIGDETLAAAGIARCFADAGLSVTLSAVTQDSLDRSLSAVRASYSSAVTAGGLRQADAEARLASIQPRLAFADLADADLFVEAVSEDIGLKRDVLSAIDRIAKRGAIVATRTSSLSIDELAGATTRPEDVVGMHFFAPAETAKGLEIARTTATAPDVCVTAIKLGKALGKVPVLVLARPGLVADRMLDPCMRQAIFLVDEGALPEQIDEALYEFGFPAAPFSGRDRGGGARDRISPLPMIDPHRIQRRTVDDEEIVERCLYAAINEGARILEQGIATRPLEIDMIWVHGLGFPIYRGGPMFYADQLGLPAVYEAVCGFRERLGPEWWTPAPLLERLARERRGFYG